MEARNELTAKIRLTCHVCQQSLQAAPELAGRTLSCPRCAEPLIVPQRKGPPESASAERSEADRSSKKAIAGARVNWLGLAACAAAAALTCFPPLSHIQLRLASQWPGWVLISLFGTAMLLMVLRRTEPSRVLGLISGLTLIATLGMVALTVSSLKLFNHAYAVAAFMPAELSLEGPPVRPRRGAATWNNQTEAELDHIVAGAAARGSTRPTSYSSIRFKFPRRPAMVRHQSTTAISVAPHQQDKQRTPRWNLVLQLSEKSQGGQPSALVSADLPWGKIAQQSEDRTLYSSWLGSYPLEIGTDLAPRYGFTWVALAQLAAAIAVLYCSVEPEFYGRSPEW